MPSDSRAVLASYLQLLRAPNPGPMTLDGTNTWLLGDPGVAPVVVVDPGPVHRGHRDAVLDAAGGRISVIVLTHRHADHSDGAPELARRAGCAVRAADPGFCSGPTGLADGDRIAAAGVELRALATPGHTSDSVSLLLTGDDGVTRLLTGDTVLGRGTAVISHPDGDVASYLRSLDLLERLVAEEQVREILPGHGPRVPEPGPRLLSYRRHRLERLQQVRAALAAGDRTPAEVVARVYADVDPSLWSAAEQSVAAQLEYLTGLDT